jgi:hypothetical protein
MNLLVELIQVPGHYEQLTAIRQSALHVRGVARVEQVLRPPREAQSKGQQDEYFKFKKMFK